MIHDHSKLTDILDFFLNEPESEDDHYELLKECSVDDLRKVMDLGASLVGAGARVMKG